MTEEEGERKGGTEGERQEKREKEGGRRERGRRKRKKRRKLGNIDKRYRKEKWNTSKTGSPVFADRK